jgi:hypothetical protein
MKIDEGCINHNVVHLVTELTEDIYNSTQYKDATCLAMMLAEIRGALELAEILKGVLME